MGQKGSIPYSELYQEWLTKECVKTMTLYRDAFSVGTLKLHPGMTIPTMIDFEQRDISFIVVTYPDPYHVAILLYRKSHPSGTPTIEYIDSMPMQNKLQMHLEYNISKLPSNYIGSKDMYGYKDEKYLWEPPQNLENLLVNNPDRADFEKYKESLKTYGASPMKDTGRVKQYLKSMQNFDGGDCIFWCHYIAGKLIENNISSIEWFTLFRENVIQSPEAVSVFIIKKIMKSLGRCVTPQRVTVNTRPVVIEPAESVKPIIEPAKQGKFSACFTDEAMVFR